MQKTIIAISRQCGSGGHTIGEELAQKLGVPFYDKAYLDRLAGDEENKDLSATNLLFTLSESTGMYDGYLLSKPESASESRDEAAIIRNLADQGPCVMVGGCADFILRDREDCLRVFIHSSLDARVERMVKEYGLSKEQAQHLIRNKDALRSRHYNFACDIIWGKAENYHIALDSCGMGFDRCIELIQACCK